ncbi:MAG: hypothetical protein IJ542_02885 [Clostridia bacterium]|nr:hypothetical protein [Clostridia bacterium]
MDYAKYSYIKISELQEQKSDEVYSNSALELANPLIDRIVADSFTIDAGNIDAKGNLYFQNKMTIDALQSSAVMVEILLDGAVILSETHNLLSGEHSIISMKVRSVLNKKNISVKVRIKVISSNTSVTVKSNVIAIWGSVKIKANSSGRTMRALTQNNSLILSYVEDNNIYYSTLNLTEQLVPKSQFSVLSTGISHCFSYDKQGNLHFFRVDTDGNLMHSVANNFAQESFVESGVSCVYASKCPDSMNENILICYIKNSKPFYRTITGSTLGGEASLTNLNQKFSDVSIVDAENSSRMYVVCTTEFGDNYIFFSEEDSLISGFAERLNLSAQMLVSRYVNLSNLVRDLQSTINASASFSVLTDYLSYQNLFSNGLLERLYANANISESTYQIEAAVPILYTLQYNQLLKFNASVDSGGNHVPRVAYGEDASEMTPAKIQFATNGSLGPGTFVDSSNWMSKWPFNEIKPCLMKNAEVVGYLNPNNFAEFENGTAADITSGNYEVMIQFPKIYWKIEEDWDGLTTITTTKRANIKVSVSNMPREGFVCHSHTKQGQEYDYVYVSAYESHIENGKVYSCSGKLPTSDLNHVQVLEQWSTLMDSQYTTLDYHFTTYIHILVLLLFGELYGLDYFGNGWVNQLGTLSKVENSGALNSKGMFYGDNSSGRDAQGNPNQGGITTIHNKLFGLENLWGHSKTYCDGILWNENRNYLIIDPTNSASTHNVSGTNYQTINLNLSGDFAASNYVTLYRANNTYGFLPYLGKTTSSYKYYTQTRFSATRPSQYSNGANLVANMMFVYGGEAFRHTGFGFACDKDYNPTNIYHNERVMCFPNSKKSN